MHLAPFWLVHRIEEPSVTRGGTTSKERAFPQGQRKHPGTV
jgi:hypothetical protein